MINSTKNKKTVGITGASGALGKELTKLFRKKGYKVIGFTHSKTNYKINPESPNEWINYLKQNQIHCPSSVYVKKIGYVSSESLKIKIQDKNICNIGVEELSEKFNNSISGHF